MLDQSGLPPAVPALGGRKPEQQGRLGEVEPVEEGTESVHRKETVAGLGQDRQEPGPDKGGQQTARKADDQRHKCSDSQKDDNAPILTRKRAQPGNDCVRHWNLPFRRR